MRTSPQTGVAIRSQYPETIGEAQRLPLLTKGELPPCAHWGCGDQNFPFLTIPQSRACVGRASQLPLHKGAVGAPAPVRLSMVLGISGGLPRQCEHWFAMTYALPGAFFFECHPLSQKTHTGNAIRHCPYTIRGNPLGGILGGISVLAYASAAPRFRQASWASSSGASWQITLSQASFAPSA